MRANSIRMLGLRLLVVSEVAIWGTIVRIRNAVGSVSKSSRRDGGPDAGHCCPDRKCRRNQTPPAEKIPDDPGCNEPAPESVRVTLCGGVEIRGSCCSCVESHSVLQRFGSHAADQRERTKVQGTFAVVLQLLVRYVSHALEIQLLYWCLPHADCDADHDDTSESAH